jgi:hypothetical protein
MVRAALEQTRVSADIEIPDLAAALRGMQRREEQELCRQLRLRPRRFAEYRRALLAGMTPLSHATGAEA